MMKFRWFPTIASSAALTSLPIEAATDFYGPLRTYAQSPMQSVSHTNYLRSAFSLPADYFEAHGSAAIASVWAHTYEYALDYYHNQIELGGKWQISDHWQWEFNYRWVFAADNHLDGLTQSFHDLFSIDQNGRDEVSNNRFYISMPHYDVYEDNFEGQSIVNSLSTYLQYHLMQDKHHALSLGGSLYYNYVSHGPFKRSNFEQGVQLNYSYLRDAHAIYTMAGATFRTDASALVNLPYRHTTVALAGGYRYAIAEKHHFLIEYHWYQGSNEGPDEFSDAANEVAIGYRYLMQSSAIELIATENVRNMDNSTDIALAFGYRYLFSPDY